MIEIGRRGIGVLYIQMDLHLPEIISVILGKGTDVIHPQAAYRGHGSAASAGSPAPQSRPDTAELSIRQPETFRKLRREILQDINILLSEIKQILPAFIIHDVQLECNMILAMPQKLVNLL